MLSIVNYIKFGFVFLIFLQTQKCNEQQMQNAQSHDNEINEVEASIDINSPLQKVKLNRHGGMMGHQENLIVTKDSTFYSFKNRKMQQPEQINSITPVVIWNSMVKTFDAEELSKLKDGQMKVMFDGIDDVFILQGDFATKEVRNPTENPTDLNPFFELLNKYRSELYEEVRKK